MPFRSGFVHEGYKTATYCLSSAMHSSIVQNIKSFVVSVVYLINGLDKLDTGEDMVLASRTSTFC